MFTINNLSTNALPMPDGSMIAPVGHKDSSRKTEEVGAQMRGFAKRGWVSIFEEKAAETARIEDTNPAVVIPVNQSVSKIDDGGKRK